MRACRQDVADLSQPPGFDPCRPMEERQCAGDSPLAFEPIGLGIHGNSTDIPTRLLLKDLAADVLRDELAAEFVWVESRRVAADAVDLGCGGGRRVLPGELVPEGCVPRHAFHERRRDIKQRLLSGRIPPLLPAGDVIPGGYGNN